MSIKDTAAMMRPSRDASSSQCNGAAYSARSSANSGGRSAIEPLIGHMKSDGHLGRSYLKGRAGEAANAILSAVGHNFRLVLAWLRALLRLIYFALAALFAIKTVPNPAS
jgi:hypothetical protein